ncbi:MAG: alpha-L-fucosidase [Pirellulales bacterium]
MRPDAVMVLDVICRSLREWGTPVAAVLTIVFLAPNGVQGAAVTRQVFVHFNGTLTPGNAYMLGAGEIDVTGTFRKNGAATITGGVADVPGNVDATSGFLFNAATLPSLTATNWVSEAILIPDVPTASQSGTFNHLLDVQGDLFYRYNGNGAGKISQIGYWNGSSEPTSTVPSLPTAQYSHIALTWTAATHTLTGFLNGVSVGSVSSASVFATPSTNVGYGFFARTGFLNRAFDGKLEAVAFSTYTGAFNPGFGPGLDFQLNPNDASPLALELVVNTVSGEVSIVNNTAAPVALQGYELTSAAGTLDVTSNGWHSLAEQNLSPVSGGDGPGETWQEGANPSTHALLEGFLLGSSTIASGGSLSLGRAYDEVLGGEDLAFRYRVASQSGLIAGEVTYDHSAPPLLVGDYNNNGVVDAADYSTWRDHLNGTGPLANDATPATIDQSDYDAWKANFGDSAGSGAGSTAGASVPEPATCFALLIAASVVVHSRRRLLFVLIVAGTATGFSGVVHAQAPPAAYLQTPAPRQLAWHQLEYYAFLHFGHNTFTNEEWGWSQSTPNVFNPTSLDTDQWAKSFADAGMTGMILTAKHHDGMALWDTATTQYKVANSTWAQNRAAQGLDANVVRMAAESAKKYGLKFGVYLSPWDMHRDPAVAKAHLAGTIYDEPQIFGDSTPGDYNDMYAQQLTELVTMQLSDGSPIELFEVWLDGASGSNTVQTFDWNRFRDIIRTNQPNAVMWGHQGVDARWVGNEDGFTVPTNWHTISRTQDQTRYSGTQLQTGVRDGTYWTPSEADARLRSGWFYHPNEEPKSADDLMTMYRQTVGRSINLLLDVPPDTSGKIVQEDVDALMEFKFERDDFLNRELVTPGLATTASSVRGNNSALFGPGKAIDGDANTYWTMNDGQTTGSFEVDLGGVRAIDAFVVQEHIALGQRIGGYAIDAFVNGAFQTVVTGTSLGYKRIDTLGAPVETTRVRFRVTQANAVPLIQDFQVLGVEVFGAIGDLNLDSLIDLADWQQYIAGVGLDMSSLSPLERFQAGDLNNDGRNDLADFDLFVSAYDGAHGAGALAADLSVPEPQSLALACLGGLLLAGRKAGLRAANLAISA